MIEIPPELAASHTQHSGARGRAFIAALPGLAARSLDRWGLRTDGPPMHGMVALVLPVVRADGTPAVLKLQPADEETEGEPTALRAWGGAGAVRLLDHDPTTGTMLLERLDPSRTLARHPDTHEAVLVVAHLLAHLTATAAPPGLRRLSDLAQSLLDRAPKALEQIPDPATRRLLADCAAAVREVVDTPGDRLLHWDLHYGNVLAADRAPWLAIDPKPLAGDPGFDLLPALANRFDPADIPWRLDALTDVLGLDPARARAWTLGRVLQNCLWEIEERGPAAELETEVEIARRVRGWSPG
ncbi:aminoglycoside phosphotransferase family protein [Streptomyces sp. NPDC091377]|uniref:aminoglycoside phosphotransferase family protein n=1 Tax=Streptomyces sp. NPDC091377 TaxID=3365995 RepID=UPI0037F92EE2